MTRTEDLVGAALEALRPAPDVDAYTWFGRRFEVPGSGTLVEALAGRLYVDFHCTGAAAPRDGAGEPPPPVESPGFVARLSAANRGAGWWQPGWRVVGDADGVGVVVARDRLAVVAPPEDVALDASGATAAVRRPKQLLNVAPGFYVAVGDAGEPRGASLDRLYLHVSSDDAPALVEAVTTELNDRRVPFLLKVLSDPRGFGRCDPVVLYVADGDGAAATAAVAAISDRLGDRFLPGVPAFARALSVGVGFAEDPGDGESFGYGRCRLLAEAALDAHGAGIDTPGGRLACARQRFARAGLDLSRPHLRARRRPVPNGRRMR